MFAYMCGGGGHGGNVLNSLHVQITTNGYMYLPGASCRNNAFAGHAIEPFFVPDM